MVRVGGGGFLLTLSWPIASDARDEHDSGDRQMLPLSRNAFAVQCRVIHVQSP